MIKIKLTFHELEAFLAYLRDISINRAVSNDKLKEFFIAHALNRVMKRVFDKIARALPFLIDYPSTKKYTVNIDKDEAVALSISFNRYTVPPFLANMSYQVLKSFQVNTELVQILKP